jgi:hypothetical protein
MLRKTITTVLAGVTGLAVLALPSAALAAGAPGGASAGAAAGSGTKPLHLRKGLTLQIPSSWKVYQVDKDWLRVVTGRCARPDKKGWGFREPECRSFWVMGPKAIKVGHELFQAYTPDGPFYPATDVGPCPYDKKLWLGQMTLAKKGLRQVGPGHKAHYRDWRGACVSTSTHKVKGHFHQREWFLPTSKILIIDQWKTPALPGILKNATWN